MNWSDQYKSPEWQKKRLEVMESAKFQCQRCLDSESTLHVHHKRYVKGRNVWEYSKDELSVLCESCHSIAHEQKDAFNDMMAMVNPPGFEMIYALVSGFLSEIHSWQGLEDERLDRFKDLSRSSRESFYAGVLAASSLHAIGRATDDTLKGANRGEN